MLKFPLAALICASLMTSVTAGPGRPLEPKRDDRGQYIFKLRYAYDKFRIFRFKFTPDLTPEEQKALPPRLYWAIVDVTDTRTYHAWTPISREAFLNEDMEIRNFADITALVPNLRRAALVIGAHPDQPLYRVAFAPLCESQPMDVLDLSNIYNKACEVAPGQLPVTTKPCAGEISRMESQIARGRISCNAANDRLGLLRCDYLTCAGK